MTLGDRMRLALGDRPMATMHEPLGVSKATVSKWVNNRTVPNLGIILAWSVLTGVDYDWLSTGLPLEHVGRGEPAA